MRFRDGNARLVAAHVGTVGMGEQADPRATWIEERVVQTIGAIAQNQGRQVQEDAAGRAAARSPGVQQLDGRGASAVVGAWHAQLSCALQKANVAGLRGACGDARLWSDAGAADVVGAEEAGVLVAVDDVLACAAGLAALAR